METLLAELKAHGAAATVHAHPAVLTSEEAEAHIGGLPGAHIKNLLVSDKKHGVFLITMLTERRVDMKAVARALSLAGANLRFCDKEALKAHLGVEQGALSPLALANDADGKVTFVLDDGVLKHESVLAHPLVNTATLSLPTAALVAYATRHGHAPKTLDFDALAAAPPPAAPAVKADGPAKGAGASNGGGGGKGSAAAAKGETGLSLQNSKESDFTAWYTEVILKSEMIEYYDISGCYILRPWSFTIWDSIRDFLDALIKTLGVQNCYFPLFISKSALEAEKDHVEGFAPEVAWVTKSGDGDLAEPIAVRPTSETIMYPAYAKWIRSHRDLPLKLNQWNNVVRWEFKYPTPFLRSREFLWQEGHTAHATKAEADKEVLQVLDFYRRVYEELLAVPVIKGTKTDKEKFAGGDYTTTVEGFIAHTGRGIQGATSHCLGQNFGKMFKIEFEDERSEKQIPWQNSWGLTTRTIGVMVMTHSDNKGLVLPPRVAPIQLVVVPIPKKGADAEVFAKAEEVAAMLQAAGVRTTCDTRANYTPGWKYSHWELKGVPLRLEIGVNDLAKRQATLVRRDTGDKCEVPMPTLLQKVALLLVELQHDLLARATRERDERIKRVLTWAEFVPTLDGKCMALTPFCNETEWEDKVKELSREESLKRTDEAAEDVRTSTSVAAKTLCIPHDQPELPAGTPCFVSGKPAKCWVLWGRSY
ncbi:hypothetical protein KFE25_007761 [Diacronema lutheri]|uniref:proline--tRNA ligase n=1 Tax=Diacronema lutheri TaxID=2081491 RepID=A0A8J5XPR1_DIALT|nr:hypothetical protein KFE25_007761 [Diacronema lutheri]